MSNCLLQRYSFQTFQQYLSDPKNKNIILRHDVDSLPENSLRFAQIQDDFGINGSYYFRAVPESWDEDIIKDIAGMGHEVGYHYETMDTANGDIDKAWDQFRYHLDELRKLANVTTICMHGSPRSKFDNKELWKKYDYKSVGIFGEPYFDVDFGEVFYLTDTGRRWDGWKVSVRDKVSQQDEWIKQGLIFHSTNDISRAVEKNNFLDKVMITFHPQRWHNRPLPWINELVMQNVKNQIKRLLIKNNIK